MIEAQALDRVHRFGQTRDVVATRYIVKNSIEIVSPSSITAGGILTSSMSGDININTRYLVCAGSSKSQIKTWTTITWR